ncbi:MULTISPECIES: peptide ABC transporter substrate-binding protein [Aerococcus]|uniref:peptide ABC transporter substrate-binding protein n=1 Tax=Aerococcus TaxID=1375 RepID=UPI003B21824C
MKKIALGLVAAVVLAACGTKEEATEKVLNIQSTDEIQSADTAFAASNIATITANMNFYNGLYTYDLDNQLIAADADDMPTVSEDGTVYTIKLKETATWSNGDPVTANDYVYAWRRMVDPDLGAPYAYMFDGTIDNATEIMAGELAVSELGVQAVDDKTLVITLENPTAYFTDLLTVPAYYPQNQEVVEVAGDQYGSTSDTAVYNGPFVLANWDAATGNTWTFAKNDHYWDADKVNLDAVNFQYLPETATALNLYDSGQLDVIELTGNFAVQNQNNGDYQTYPIPRTNYIEVNHETPGLDNLNIRRAIYQAIDREAFVDNILQNGSIASNAFVSREVAWNPDTDADFRDDATIETDYDLETAQENWENGLTEAGIDSLSLEMVAADDEESQIFAEYIQSQLTENLPGIEVTIKTMPSSARFAALSDGDYDLGVTFWQADFGDPINYLERFDSTITRGNYQYDELDELVAQSRAQALNPSGRWETLIMLEKAALDDYAVQIPVYQSYQAILENLRVFDINRPGQSYINYRWADIQTAE